MSCYNTIDFLISAFFNTIEKLKSHVNPETHKTMFLSTRH